MTGKLALVGTETVVVVVLVVAVLVWGPKMVPEFARALGQAKRAFEQGKKETESKE